MSSSVTLGCTKEKIERIRDEVASITVPAAAPRSVISFCTLSDPKAPSVNVPAGSWIVSGPDPAAHSFPGMSVLAANTASRNEQPSPAAVASAWLETVMVAAGEAVGTATSSASAAAAVSLQRVMRGAAPSSAGTVLSTLAGTGPVGARAREPLTGRRGRDDPHPHLSSGQPLQVRARVELAADRGVRGGGSGSSARSRSGASADRGAGRMGSRNA